MKKLILILVAILFCSELLAQKANTELGLHFLFTSTREYWSLMDGNLGFKTTVGFPTFNDKDLYDDFYKQESITQKRTGTPEFFVRQRVYNNWWVKVNASYIRHHVFSTDTTYDSWYTGGTTYYNYNSNFKEIALGIAPQYQWYNKKRLYINSGINFNLSLWQFATEKKGFSCGCFNCEEFNESYRRSGLSFHSLLSTHSIAYRVYNRFNLGYETMLGYDNATNSFVFRNAIFASVMFK